MPLQPVDERGRSGHRAIILPHPQFLACDFIRTSRYGAEADGASTMRSGGGRRPSRSRKEWPHNWAREAVAACPPWRPSLPAQPIRTGVLGSHRPGKAARFYNLRHCPTLIPAHIREGFMHNGCWPARLPESGLSSFLGSCCPHSPALTNALRAKGGRGERNENATLPVERRRPGIPTPPDTVRPVLLSTAEATYGPPVSLAVMREPGGTGGGRPLDDLHPPAVRRWPCHLPQAAGPRTSSP